MSRHNKISEWDDMQCVLCGRTMEDIGKTSENIYVEIQKALNTIERKKETISNIIAQNGVDSANDENNPLQNYVDNLSEEIIVLRQRIKKLDRITFTHVDILDKATQIIKKHTIAAEMPNKYNGHLVCMHCKIIIDTLSYPVYDTK
jgi:hypothetical protein